MILSTVKRIVLSNIISILNTLLLLIELPLEFVMGVADVIVIISTIGFYNPYLRLRYEREYLYGKIIFSRWHTHLATMSLKYIKE